ncbi:hypothetical protein O1611_g7611 [Lasiodiplodia mahajangana]|uniref:Uncharacterized protein n=1 Tax=Lasiodiplodia mahajangana TaxID=1108764 RepID=A0ACC2JEX6_9PEZI|nr:hypothetical protein O1611_g7611 [Lasiodiplodia mahajangana]
MQARLIRALRAVLAAFGYLKRLSWASTVGTSLADTLRWLALFVKYDSNTLERKPEQQQAADITTVSLETTKTKVLVDEQDQKTKPIPIPTRRSPRVVYDPAFSRSPRISGKKNATVYQRCVRCRRIREKSPFPVSPGHDVSEENDEEDKDEDRNGEDVIMEPNPLQRYGYADEALKASSREIRVPPQTSLLTEGLRKCHRQIEGESCSRPSKIIRIQSTMEHHNMLSRRQNTIMQKLKAEGQNTRIPVCKKPGTMEWGFEQLGSGRARMMSEPIVPVWIQQSEELDLSRGRSCPGPLPLP